MSANTETTGGPPKGYFLCPDCKTTWAGVGLSCWGCRLEINPSRQFSEADTFKAYPDWTPPIAAPAAHVAATPEPAKPCVCPHGPHATDGKCPIHVTAGMESSGFQGCACAKCVPPAQEAPKYLEERARCGYVIMSTNREAAITAVGKHQAGCVKCLAQEAPKAAPVCGWRSRCCKGPPVARVVRVRVDAPAKLMLMCDGCYTALEDYTNFGHGEGLTDEGRLPRPQLAADWVEDCLPESGR